MSSVLVDGALVCIDYTNHRGERSHRWIIPEPNSLRLAESPWHQGKQWLIDAIDYDKVEVRTFAMKDIHSWAPEPTDKSKAIL